jgi:GAF domain-containing protein
LPENEQARVAALKTYPLPGVESDSDLNRLVGLIAALTDAPIALITVIKENWQQFLAKVGTQLEGTPRDLAFCSHTILGTSLLVIEDFQRDERFSHHPLVIGDPYLRFYAGVPLVSEEGFALGSVCVLDRKPRTLTQIQVLGLEALTRQIVHQLELRRKASQYGKAKEALRAIAEWQSHQVRAELASMLGLLQLMDQQELGEENLEYFTLLLAAAQKMDQHLRTSVKNSFES